LKTHYSHISKLTIIGVINLEMYMSNLSLII